MSDYIATLEKQNEELKKLLAEAQAFIAWKDSRILDKIRFNYMCETEEGQEICSTPLLRETFKSNLERIRKLGIDRFLRIHYKKRKIRRYRLIIGIWKHQVENGHFLATAYDTKVVYAYPGEKL